MNTVTWEYVRTMDILSPHEYSNPANHNLATCHPLFQEPTKIPNMDGYNLSAHEYSNISGLPWLRQTNLTGQSDLYHHGYSTYTQPYLVLTNLAVFRNPSYTCHT